MPMDVLYECPACGNVVTVSVNRDIDKPLVECHCSPNRFLEPVGTVGGAH